MKLFVAAFALIAAVGADVSHLKGYSYPRPIPAFHDGASNGPHNGDSNGLHHEAPQIQQEPLQQQYLPPAHHDHVVHQQPEYVQPSPVAPVVPVEQPTAVSPAPVHHSQQPAVQQKYLPPVVHHKHAVHQQPQSVQLSPVKAPAALVEQPEVAVSAPVYQPQQPAVQQKYLPTAVHHEHDHVPEPIAPAADFSENTGYSYKVPSARF